MYLLPSRFVRFLSSGNSYNRHSFTLENRNPHQVPLRKAFGGDPPEFSSDRFASAHGLLYLYRSQHTTRHGASDDLAGHTPYVVVMVEIDAHPDLPRVVGNLIGDLLEPVGIGDRVVGRFEDGTLLNWLRDEGR